MSFDIQKHLKDHSDYYKKYDEIKSDDLHFKFSILDLYFVANNYENPGEKLQEILKELREPKEYTIREKNGFYKGKQKYANRVHKIDLSKVIKIEAIHTKGADDEYTMPHGHLIIDKNARLGKDYSLLKHHISKVLREHNLIPSFDEINRDSYKYKNLQKSISKFFWSLKQADNTKFKKHIGNDEKLTQYLNLFYEYAKQSNNLSYFFKTMNHLQKRLNSLNIDFIYREHNLKNTYSIDFILDNQDNKKVLEMLQNKNFTQKNIQELKDNAILRDGVRYTINKKNALIIGEIKSKTHLLDNFRKNSKLLDNYKKVISKDLPQRATKSKIREKGKFIYQNAFNKALNLAKNEKELREILNKDFKFSFKKRKGKTIGFTFNDNYLSVKDLNYNDISEIRAIMISNSVKGKESGLNQSNGQVIEYKTQQIESNKQRRKENVKISRKNKKEFIKFSGEIESRESKTQSRESTISRIGREIESRKSTIIKTESDNNDIKHSTQSRKSRIRNTIQSIGEKFQGIRSKIGEFGKRVKRFLSDLFKQQENEFVELEKQIKELRHPYVLDFYMATDIYLYDNSNINTFTDKQIEILRDIIKKDLEEKQQDKIREIKDIDKNIDTTTIQR